MNTPIEKRDPYLTDDLKIFPYVNGGLFDGSIEIPNFTDEIKNLLLDEASSNFNWSGISPTIFGAVFESTLNPTTRRAGGMHYTSIENIHKVIDPLFLNDLHDEFRKIVSIANPKSRKSALLDFQNKLATLKFFDPACGSGNFLTESFICIRRLENAVLRDLFGSQIQLGAFVNPVKVSINQFFGIEINDFACTVAKTALWIAELQMIQETMEIIHRDLDFLPLKSYANITEGNALHLDWKAIAPDVNFIMGNPPFVGRRYRNALQVADIAKFFTYKDVDYVACWYKKAAEFIHHSHIEVAFVSTNSITQGEQVAAIFENLPITINFAYKTFRWDSESNSKAHVHCVIIGFASFSHSQKFIFDGDNKIWAKNINCYLNEAPTVFIRNRSNPLCNVLKMFNGNMAADGKNFTLSETEMLDLVQKYPAAKNFIKNLLGGEELLHSKPRYCLWLVDATISEIKKISPIFDRVKKVRDFRLNSTFKNIADRPHLFRDLKNPKSFIAIPQVSSENRQYIPMDFLDDNFIPTTQLMIIPDADLFYFGVLTSKIHMAWLKTVAGRLKSDFRYSAGVVYNNFVWCNPTPEQRQKIKNTAQKILDTRKNYPYATLADLYDDTLMPKDLRDAHKENDAAVLAAYNFPKDFTDSDIVAELMNLYSLETSGNNKFKRMEGLS